MAYLDVISLATAKSELRVDDTLTEDDDRITQMIESALSFIEGMTNHYVYARNKNYRLVSGFKRVYDYPINSVISPVANVYATATAQCTSVIATNTIVVNGLTYTAISGQPTSYAQFSIGTDTACAASLAKSINGDTRTGTTGKVTATSSGDTVTLTTNKSGFNGNAITLAQTGDTITLSGATFSGGFDGDVDFIDITEYTSYTTYCYGSDNGNLTLNVGYSDPDDVPSGLKDVAHEIIDILYYGKETGRTMADLSPMSMDIMNRYKRFII